MNELAMPGTAGLIGSVIGGVIGFFLCVLIFRSACDLASVEPPGWLKSAGLVLLGAVLGAPVVFVAYLAAGLLGLSREWGVALAFFLSLPFVGALTATVYMFALRVRFTKGLLIWVLQSLLGTLASAVILLLLIGVWSIADAAPRLPRDLAFAGTGMTLVAAALIGHLWMLVVAFTDSAKQGLLCLLVPFYSLYYVIARVEGGSKWAMLSLAACAPVGFIVSRIA